MQDLIERIQNRDSAAFRQLVAKHQRLLYSIALSYVGADAADDVVQATWTRAIAKISQLRDKDKLTSWLCRICRNVILEARRKNTPDHEEFDDEILNSWTDESRSYEEYESMVRLALHMLSEAQRTVVQLRYFQGLSYTEIALVCNIEMKLVKSRLFEAKKSLKKHLSNLYDGIEISRKTIDSMEEYAMNEFEKATLGAEVFCRLSLDTQMKLVESVRMNEELTPEVLAGIGKVGTGVKFVEEFHNRILLPELVNILNACDRYTEARLVEGLETAAPFTAEFVKMNTYVFEDLAIISEESRRLLYEKVERRVLMTAMSAVGSRVKAILLSHLSEEEQADWFREMGGLDSAPEAVRKAQLEVVLKLRELDKDDLVEICGMPDAQ